LMALRDKVAVKKAKIGIFGAGYVGLPLACAFAQAGFTTIAGDSDQAKVDAIRRGSTYVEDEYTKRTLPRLVASNLVDATTDTSHVASIADFLIITVPTPLTDDKRPDLTFLTNVAKTIAKEIRPGKFVITESSVYPGTTEEIIKPILEQGGLKAGDEFGLAYSPERIDYGNTKFAVFDIPKVVGGVTPLCTQIACDLYSKILRAPVIAVSNPKTAEATKMLENTYRYVNIALANELAIVHEKMGIDYFEVLAAASTKPFGFQAFYPGPGVGGHCIPKDPHYLLYKVHQLGGSVSLIDLSTAINERMTDYIMGRLAVDLENRHKPLGGSKAAILGLAFKPEVSDTRRSPAIALAGYLIDKNVQVSAYDPFAKSVVVRNGLLKSESDAEAAVRDADIIFLVTSHSQFRHIELRRLANVAKPGATVFDTRGFWSRAECEAAGFRYLGLGRP